MRKRALLVSAVAMVAVLVAGGLFASNMGFKLNFPMEKQLFALNGATVATRCFVPNTPPCPSRTGTQTLALPYNQQTNLLNEFDLITDMGGTGVVTQIGKWVSSGAAADGYQAYTGTSGAARPLTPGEGYLVGLAPGAPSPLNYIVVGSHNPGLGINLPGLAGTRTGTSVWSYPYHSTAANGLDLIVEINAFGGAGTVVQIAQYNQNLDGPIAYTGTSGTAPALLPGEAVYIQLTSAINGWVPSHY